MKSPLHVRFAPSPTGFMHLGGLRTALLNYLAARSTQGSMTLRIEDTDTERTVPGAVEELVEMLEWSGIRPDKGIRNGRVDAEYVQSRRREIYGEYAGRLIEEGKAYRCICTKERLQRLRLQRQGYDRHCRSLGQGLTGGEGAIRLNAAASLRSLAEQEGKRPEAAIEDAVLVKSDGMPTYHFANVVDDHLMNINCVMRGQEWLPSTPLHVAIYAALGWARPAFVHLPLLVKADGTKLSKRQGDAYVSHYRQAGFLPEALVNFVATLGWTIPKGHAEVCSMETLVKLANATVDVSKLAWFNRQHIQRRILADDAEMLDACPDSVSLAYKQRALSSIRHRLDFVADIRSKFAYLFVDPEYTDQSLKPADYDRKAAVLLSLAASTDNYADFFAQAKAQVGDVNACLRFALTGCKIGIPLADLYDLIGRDASIRRLKSPATLPCYYELDCRVQHYEWGKYGDGVVARLSGHAGDKPCAEVDPLFCYPSFGWGRMQAGPLSSSPQAILPAFLCQLPLGKVLSVNKALSIQAHPDKELAASLHAAQPEHYKDANHKPEMAIALNRFEALCGFMPVEQVRESVEGIEELREIVGEWRDLRGCFSAVMKCNRAGELSSRLYSRLKLKAALNAQERLFTHLYEQFPFDVGCFCAFLLNHLTLSPGQAVFLAANEPHAYLAGDCIEVMATSDNVVRAGLTPKHRDVETLCSMLTYKSYTKEGLLLEAEPKSESRRAYRAPITEFAVDRIEFWPQSVAPEPISAGSIAIVIDGVVTVSGTRLSAGSVVYAQSLLEVCPAGSQALLFVAYTPK